MSSGQILSRTILKFPMSMLVKGTTVPSNPIEDHNIDIQKPIIYALPYRSNVDLFVLQKQALQLGLPDPLEPISINGNSFNRYVFISSRHTLMNRDQDIPSESINLFSDLLALHKTHSQLDIQIIPTSVLWGRKPGKEAKHTPYLQAMNGLQKLKPYLHQAVTAWCALVLLFRCAIWPIHMVQTRLSHTSSHVLLAFISRAKNWLHLDQTCPVGKLSLIAL